MSAQITHRNINQFISERTLWRSEGAALTELQPRLQFDKIAPEALRAVLQVSAYINNHSGLEPSLLNLVYLRASQINGFAWCIDMHTKDARALGETEQRLLLVSAWREAPFYTERERAALAWTEAVTLVAKIFFHLHLGRVMHSEPHDETGSGNHRDGQ